MRVDGLLFDKDGTLFDFGATWNTWAAHMIRSHAGEDDALAYKIADEMDYDLDAGTFLPHSLIIAGTNRDAAEAVARALPDADVEALENQLMLAASRAPLVPAVPLAPYLDGLAQKGLRLGVMTNDTEYAARAHLNSAGVAEKFDFIAGFDSGYGAKPDPDPLLAFADQMKLSPKRVAMVGDSTHDLVAGRAAGMQTIAVLTGMATAEELLPFADAVFANIGHITDWVSAG
ncbi:HAD family hydrolase [Shimia thalassica]|uniref:phosphoglycolate phosphatase n=1 Tax=Shimia thalassica TaxID=1715693 RepID=A0A0P1I5H8_9RHOB|nr:HAD family hydrolase [Shimia thalassica]PHO03670.1 HAD family hydrolase [Rhodobacteraceae bacterium 4F10]MBU2942201.1 HAD family hydrolase [Shimia thalassica]MDO6478401.1 HAD family hydrolase [Shimia thalassica]MDO6502829.1 HAD family hydrolase [Shimia thalassica]MDO6522568.1 HAD family hydrolase [Shimia thalassica]